MRAILDYMYKGEVSVGQEELPALLRVAEMLKVKGMTEEGGAGKGGASECKDRAGAGRTSPAPPPNSSMATTPHSNGGEAGGSGSGQITPQLPPPPGAIPPNFRPFMGGPAGSSNPPFPMWPLPGLFPGGHPLFSRGEDRAGAAAVSPGPGRDRAKLNSGSSSDKESGGPLPPLIPRESLAAEQESKGDQGYPDPRNPYHNEKSPNSGLSYTGQDKVKGEGIAGYVPTQRLEWKRYKQYTRNDIMAAIEEVKKGEFHTSVCSSVCPAWKM